MSDSHVPSAVWTKWLDDMEFLKALRPRDLRMHFGDLYLLGAPLCNDYWMARNFARGKLDAHGSQLVGEFKHLAVGIPPTFLASELDSRADEFSICVTLNDKSYWINTDIVRFQVEITNLVRHGFFDDEIARQRGEVETSGGAGGGQTIVEVGGGYGGLAVQILTAVKPLRYVIVDFEVILDQVERWVTQLYPEIPFYRIDTVEKLKHIKSESWGLFLVPQELHIEPLDCDFLINANSFFEMTEAQLIRYLSPETIQAEWIYSNNRDVQVDNRELPGGVLAALAKFFPQFNVWPNSSSLLDRTKPDSSKYVFVGSRGFVA